VTDSIDALVIGAGPAGLAAGAELRRAGIAVRLMDAADAVGSSWAKHYDRLHLHTARALSSLPGLPIPRRHGRWVSRDDFLRYLGDYAAFHQLDVRLGTEAISVDRAGNRWTTRWTSASGGGTTDSGIVVVATGYNRSPRIPEWPGSAQYRGRVLHSSAYRSAAALGASNVLVVGPGNSGAEIAADLAESGASVRLAVRTPPNIVRRQVLGIPGQVLALSISPLPPSAGDRVARLVQQVSVGDLSRYGIGRSPRGIATQMVRDDVTPTIDVGLIAALRSGGVTVVPAVVGFTADSVLLADGTEVSPDAVVLATGYVRELEPLVGRLGVLAASGRPLVNAAGQLPGAEGLYFLGYSNPLTGNLRQVALDARSLARRVRRERSRAAR
jgi:putative flavoprotein involved in K+ transport